MKKKILIIMMSMYNGGAEKSLVNMLNVMPKDKFEIDLVFHKKEGIFLEQIPEWVNIIDTPNSLKQFYSPVRIKSLFDVIHFPAYIYKIFATAISKIITSNETEMHRLRWNWFYRPFIKHLPQEYDLAVGYISGETGYYLSKVKATHKIVWVHNDYNGAKYSRMFDFEHFKYVDQIVSISDSCVDILKEVFPEFQDKMLCIPNITSDTLVKKRAEEYIPTEFSNERLNILSIGRLVEQKGFDFAIQAAAILKKQLDFKWFILGNGPLENQLKKQVEEAHLQDTVIFLGVRENPYPYIKNCDIFVQTSRYEGKSVVLDEAKILGKPIVATNYSTVKDQLIDKQEGLIVDMNGAAVAEGIAQMHEDSILRESIVKCLTSRKYGNENVIEQYIELFEKIGG